MTKSLSWNKQLVSYTVSDPHASTLQLASTLAIFLSAFAFSRYLYEISPFISLFITPIIGCSLVRLFIVQHDCGHYSYFKSRKVCDWIGRGLSLLTFTPYGAWKREHDKHHATSGNLSKRGFGDIKTLTVNEYSSLGKVQKIGYRLYRNPIVLFGLGPSWQFLIKNRLPFFETGKKAAYSRTSILTTNLCMSVFLMISGWFVGYIPFFLILIPSVVIGGTIGLWLFFVQHQYEDAYWKVEGEWNYNNAAMEGCSFYKLPEWMHWITGWIGYHHIHHLSSKIPNYTLAKVYNNIPELQNAPTFGLKESFKFARLALWCDTRKKLVGFNDILPHFVEEC